MPSKLAGSIPIIATLVLTALGVGAPTGTARTADCLASPSSPAPNGSWWYYRLDWSTQRKCWYLRALGRPTQQTTERATTGSGQLARAGSALLESTRPSDSTDDSALSLPAADTAPVGSIVQEVRANQASPGQNNIPTTSPTENDAPVVSAKIQQNADDGKAADLLPDRPVQQTSLPDRPVKQTSASSQTNAQAAAVDAADMDVVPRIKAQAVSTDDAAASVPDEYIERVVRSRKQASNEQAPISFLVIAVGLAVTGISFHFVRRLRLARNH
jgi:hypothetical protein